MSDNRPPLKPNPPRWKQNPDPASIEVPGLDTSASTNDQIDQIEQLITLKLQDIDENFSKIHTVLTNKILPAVKRYAVATEPARNAADFWIAFYEKAAQIRIPTADDYSTVNDPMSERDDRSAALSQDAAGGQTFDHSISSTGSSFQPEDAFASTPAIRRTAYPDATRNDSEASWSASLESPLVRLDRELQKFSLDGDEDSIVSEMPTMRQDPAESSRKGKEREQPLLRSVLRQNMYTDDARSPVISRGKVKTPIPKHLNPYLPLNTEPSQWNGVVDLGDPNVRTPQHGYRYTRKPTTPYDDDDEDDFGLPEGMSPPRLISPAKPQGERMKLTRTPNKQAAARITHDLLEGYQPASRYADSTMSTVSSPPSMSRYARGGGTDTSSDVAGDSTMESLLARAGAGAGLATTPGLRLKPRSRAGLTPSSKVMPPQHQPVFSAEVLGVDMYGEPVLGAFRTPGQGVQAGDNEDDDDDDWEDNEVTGNPSAAFNLLLSESRGGDDDDSFGSSSSSNSFDNDQNNDMEVEDGEPFEDSFRDSMDDDSFGQDQDGEGEDTLFGLPARRNDEQNRNHDQLVLHGEDMLGDVGLTERLDNVAESPTNYFRR